MSKIDYDIAIIGGGITGIGIAYRAASQGSRVVLLEKDRLAGAASDNSLRIIHGGFRYLQNIDLARTLFSVTSQTELLNQFPDYIEELSCLMPLEKFGLKSRFPAMLGCLMYSVFLKSVRSKIAYPKVVSREKARTLLPLMKDKFKNAALKWNDALLHDPQALTAWHAEYVRSHGGDIFHHCCVDRVVRKDGKFEVSMPGKKIFAKCVVNAASNFGRLISLEGIAPLAVDMHWAKAYNILLDKEHLGEHSFDHALGVSSDEGRLFFVVPRRKEMAIGTFYEACEGPEDSRVSDEHLMNAIDSFNATCHELRFTRNDIRKIEVGVLPCHSPYRRDADLLSKDIINDANGYFEVFASKYTTFRHLGRSVYDQIKRYL